MTLQDKILKRKLKKREKQKLKVIQDRVQESEEHEDTVEEEEEEAVAAEDTTKKRKVDDGDDKGEDEQVDVGLEERLLHAVLVLVVLLLPHQSAQHVEPVFVLICSVFT